VVFPFLAAGAVQAQEPLVLARVSGPIELDGLSGEAAWQRVEPLPMTTYSPVAGAAPSEETEVRVAYDEDFLYVAGRFYDSQPGDIQANSLTRDRWSADDLFQLVLDTYNDNESGFAFTTNPVGNRIDLAISNDAEWTNGPAFNDSWNTFWDVASRITDQGWFFEMRIPFSSLRFQDEDGRVVMGLIARRFIPRTNEEITFPAISPEWEAGFMKPSLARDVVLEEVEPRRPLYLSPYALGGLQQSFRLNDAETAFTRSDMTTREVGLDLKYGLTENLALDLTVNTDFAQVEADDQQINLTRFDLFLPEKRQFFQERAGIFDFVTGWGNRLFHSRRIGIDDDGGLVPILAGGRVVGRAGAWDVGIIDMQTRSIDRLPSENFGVVRLRRRVLNDHSTAGLLFTSRVRDGHENLAYGLDTSLRIGESTYLSVNAAQSFDRGGGGTSSSAVRALYDLRRRRGLGMQTELSWTGPDYDPGVGFVARTDFSTFRNTLSYGVFPGPDSPVRRWAPELNVVGVVRNRDRAMEQLVVAPRWVFELKNGLWVNGAVQLTRDDLDEGFQLGDADIHAGVHRGAGAWTFVGLPWTWPLHAGVFARYGTFYDGRQLTLNLMPGWRASSHLELRAEYQVNRISFPARDQVFNADLIRLRANAALNTSLSANALLQYSTVADAVLGNIRVRYNFGEGRDLYLVYNTALNTDRRAGDPTLPLTSDRVLMVKVSHTVAF